MDIKASKFLSHLLRHDAEKRNLDIRTDGFVPVNQILDVPQSKTIYKLDVEKIMRIVETNDKKRFEIIRDNGELLIRASQGHSIKKLDETKMMTEILDHNQYNIIVHGTYEKNWNMIKFNGLNRMKRNHIHFAIGYPRDKEVISGMRSTCEIFIELDIQKAMEDGIKFYLSSNKVVLSSGINGIISPKYFKTVKNINGNKLQ